MQPWRRVNVFIGDLLAVGAIGRGARSEREHRRCCSERQARGICLSWDCPEPPGGPGSCERAERTLAHVEGRQTWLHIRCDWKPSSRPDAGTSAVTSHGGDER